jgi:hypothetical protein
VKIAIYVAALTLVAPAALGQSTTWHGVANPTFSSTSTLVIVPTLVVGGCGIGGAVLFTYIAYVALSR